MNQNISTGIKILNYDSSQHIYLYKEKYWLTSKPTLTVRLQNPNNCSLYHLPQEFQRKVSMEREKCSWPTSPVYTKL